MLLNFDTHHPPYLFNLRLHRYNAIVCVIKCVVCVTPRKNVCACVNITEICVANLMRSSLLRSLFAGARFSPHVQAAYCSNTFHSNCLANHSLSTRIRNSSRKNLLIPKQRWRRMIKQLAAKSRNAHLPDAILNSAQ